jgi:hypothetical protein
VWYVTQSQIALRTLNPAFIARSGAAFFCFHETLSRRFATWRPHQPNLERHFQGTTSASAWLLLSQPHARYAARATNKQPTKILQESMLSPPESAAAAASAGLPDD